MLALPICRSRQLWADHQRTGPWPFHPACGAKRPPITDISPGQHSQANIPRMAFPGGGNQIDPLAFTARRLTTGVGGVIRTGIIAAAALAAAMVSSAAPSVAFAGRPERRSFTGLAAYYPGQGTGLTAAHRTLPFGTRMRVTDPKSGRSIVVRITDLGPFGRGRVLDLCVGAARALGMIDRGVILVRAEVL